MKTEIKFKDHSEPKPADLKIGQYYKDVSDGQIYILAKVGSVLGIEQYALISLTSGNRYSDRCPKIEDVFDCDYSDFVFVPKIEISIR